MTGFIGFCILGALVGQFSYKLLFGIDHVAPPLNSWSDYEKRTNWIELVSIGVFAIVSVALLVWQYYQKAYKND